MANNSPTVIVQGLLTATIHDASAGYLDLLCPARSGQSAALRIMENRAFAAVYERAWRPLFTRLFSLGGTATSKTNSQLLEQMARPGERRVLDVACGPGTYTEKIAQGLTGAGFCIGLDFSAPMMAHAVADNHNPRAVYVRADAHELPFRNNTFDSVCCLAALYLVTSPLDVVAEMIRVLAPAGELVIFTSLRTPLSASTPANWVAKKSGYHLFARDEITGYLAAAGLSKIRQIVTGQGQYITAVAPA